MDWTTSNKLLTLVEGVLLRGADNVHTIKYMARSCMSYGTNFSNK